MTSKTPHSDLFLNKLSDSSEIKLDGSNLSLAQIVAISRSFAKFELDQETCEIVQESENVLKGAVKDGKTVYGVTTFFGGSANQKIKDVNSVQKALLGLLAGVLPASIFKGSSPSNLSNSTLPIGHPQSHAMPSSWVRGAILLRINNFLRGHSSVRWEVIEMLCTLLSKEITPLIPIQGSISASGDLSPLSYIAFTMTGNPNVFCSVGNNPSRIMSSKDAFSSLSIEPLIYSPKEVLGLVNGTSISASVASLALSTAHELAYLSQVITSLNLEALLGCRDEFDEFIHDVARPHPGQIEVANSVRGFIERSRLIRSDSDELGVVDLLIKVSKGDEDQSQMKGSGGEKVLEIDDDGFFLKQDRYALRTSPQWLGPALEDLTSAHKSLEVEMNSTTDNPLADSNRKITLHGGNFQACSVTNATEKTRDACSIIGRMLFAQSTELVNDKLSNGLPPNLSPGEPSIDGGFKGVEIGLAALTSELGFLANRANHFVQSAEQHNQCLNSLALISARYTITAVETLAKLVASSLVLSLQALDLRSLFISNLQELSNQLKPLFSSSEDPAFEFNFMKAISISLIRYQMLDFEKRFSLTSQNAIKYLIRFPSKIQVLKEMISKDSGLKEEKEGEEMNFKIEFLGNGLKELLKKSNKIVQDRFFEASIGNPSSEPITHKYVSETSSRIYDYVRGDLKVPLYRGVFDLPGGGDERASIGQSSYEKRTIGQNVSVVYDALMDGSLMRSLGKC